MSPTGLDDHWGALGTQLDRAQARAERRRRRAIGGLSVSALAIAIGLGGLVALPGAERLDPVDRARAAVTDDDGGVLHWISHSQFIGPKDAIDPRDASDRPGIAVWMAAGTGDRGRVRNPADGRPRQCGSAITQAVDEQGRSLTIVQPMEFAFTADTSSVYSAFSRKLIVTRMAERRPDPTDADPLSAGLGLADPRDPVRTIRTALERGRLQDRGTVEHDGRTVRLLVGTSPQQLPQTPNRDTPTRIAHPNELTYYVDAHTYAPVELRTRRYTVWSRAGGYPHWEWITNIDYFSDFQRLPDTPENRALLEISTPPDTTVLHVTQPSSPGARLPVQLSMPEDPAAKQRCRDAVTDRPNP